MTKFSQKIGITGLSHLGLVTGICMASEGIHVIAHDNDKDLIADLQTGTLPISEPELDQRLAQGRDNLIFSSDLEDLSECDLIYFARDIPTDHEGNSNLGTIKNDLSNLFEALPPEAIFVLLSQVPPGFTRSLPHPKENLFYQVETLVFGRAVERATQPERYIIGCNDSTRKLPDVFNTLLSTYKCPILPMRYESAELAKISINMCLVSSISVANTMAEICEKNGADWDEIASALKLDRRIGAYSYLAPGLGIAGGNLERDLATVIQLSEQFRTDGNVVRSWINNSQHRKDWAAQTILNIAQDTPSITIAILGLAYKENTHSTKNSASLHTLTQLQEFNVKVHDPVVRLDTTTFKNTFQCATIDETIHHADMVAILTPWEEYKTILLSDIVSKMQGKHILDPYGVLPKVQKQAYGIYIHQLGAQPYKL